MRQTFFEQSLNSDVIPPQSCW